MIRIAILGSTGSIGRNTLRVVERHPDRFRVVALSAHRSVERLHAQVDKYGVEQVVLTDPRAADSSGGAIPDDWGRGRDALLEIVENPEVDVVVNALVGFAGLEPTLRALEAGKRVALANKESLVAGGDLVLAARDRGQGELVPVDSEHSAILQCLNGNGRGSVSRLLLTASGGPFRGWDRDRLSRVGPSDALDHPTWSMGAKISIDSATLANKALEVIEAHVLYGIPYSAIDAVVHPQSIVHSMVEFADGSVMAQMGFPTMELPILYALSYPERIADASLRTFDAVAASPLTFEAIDHDAFPLFRLGVRAGEAGGCTPAVYNAVNEMAVGAFLNNRIGFRQMADLVATVLDGATADGRSDRLTLDEVYEADREARRSAHDWIARHGTPGSGD